MTKLRNKNADVARLHRRHADGQVQPREPAQGAAGPAVPAGAAQHPAADRDHSAGCSRQTQNAFTGVYLPPSSSAIASSMQDAPSCMPGADAACMWFFHCMVLANGVHHIPGLWKPHVQVAINWCIAEGTVPIPGAKTLSQASRILADSVHEAMSGSTMQWFAAKCWQPKHWLCTSCTSLRMLSCFLCRQRIIWVHWGGGCRMVRCGR
jgi:hypothetical protein